jgi:hypothetical protein
MIDLAGMFEAACASVTAITLGSFLYANALDKRDGDPVGVHLHHPIRSLPRLRWIHLYINRTSSSEKMYGRKLPRKGRPPHARNV